MEENPNIRAMDVVSSVLTTNLAADQRFLAPKSSLLKRTANKFRATKRPVDPKDLNFELDKQFLRCEDFLVEDIRINNHRHIMFATALQLDILKRSVRWFMDGTFKVVSPPFKQSGQLLSIHSFVTVEGQRKQFPLVFVIMSRKTEADYVAVLQTLKDKLVTPNVQHFVLDFEIGAWLGIRRIFPDVQIKGCVFHWTQAVWRRVQENGLVRSYRENQAVHSYIRQLLALPFLPSMHIRDTFMTLKERANTPELQELVNYIDRKWFRNTIIDVQDWCVFRHSIRTNNDVEGWHNRINTAARYGGVPFYVLVPFLRREAEVIDVSIRSGDLERNVNKRTSRLERRVEDAWDRYMDREISTTRFLKTISRLYGPTDNPRDVV